VQVRRRKEAVRGSSAEEQAEGRVVDPEREEEAMSVLKRPIGRRVTGAGVGAAMMVLGLAAPALAAEPTVGAFTPTSGPAAGGCVIVLTGTGFTDFPVAAGYEVNFLDPANAPTAAVDFLPLDGTTMWVESPILLAGTEYTIEVTTHTGGTPAETAGTFLATTGAGACAPTVTSFAPSCGPAGTTVVITGTNLIQTGFEGADVAFSPYAVLATHTVPDLSDVTSLSVIVPSGSADGPIRVDTGVGSAVFSTDSFLLPPPDCPEPGGNEHARTVTLKLRKHLVAKGKVTADPELAECIAGVTVKIQRKKGGAWKSVGTATTNDAGSYKKRIKDKPGKYRARIGKLSIGDPVTDTCLGDKSPVVRHSH
jgi:IPT/TIG domain